MRVRTSTLTVALLSLWSLSSYAADLGNPVHFSTGRSFDVPVEPGFDDILFDSGMSAPIAGAWDTVIVNGVSPDEAIALEASVQSASGSWSAWQPLEARRFEGGRFWAKAAVGPGVRLRLRARDTGVADPHRLELFGAETFLSAEVEKTSAAPRPAPAQPPEVHRRAEWRAKPPKHPYRGHSPNRLTYHHTDGHYTTNLADSLNEVRFIQDFHMNGRGWDDIGYHFLIDAAGNVFEGRPENVIGAHTENANADNVGIAFLGMYHQPRHDAITKEALAAFLRIGRTLVRRYGIDPNSLKGHRDYKSTDCPGDDLYALRAQLRKELAKPGATATAAAAKPRAIRLAPIPAPRFD